MRWSGGRRSDNIEDRRGRALSGKVKGGGVGVLLVVLVAMYFGIDPSLLLDSGVVDIGPAEHHQSTPSASRRPPGEDRLAEFVSVVLADTEDTWKAIFTAGGSAYQEPRLVLFTDRVQSACGFASAASGPFYCPADRKVYIDLVFYRDLHNTLGAPGDFAQAYVIAHEIGHHVQNLLGVMGKVQGKRSSLATVEYNRLLVRLELQADCFSGIWANHANRLRKIVEPGDIEEALHAASMIGDDRLQKQGRGYVVPDSFTHGTSQQRVEWFKRGWRDGAITACNTFK